MEKIKFLDTGINTGKFNMAVDYYFSRNRLDSPIFRVYRWRPYCVSLGYHQKADEINSRECAKRGYDTVRRETGGRAVFHSEELTYSMIIPKNSELYSDSILEVYNTISNVLVRALKKAGVDNVSLKKGKTPAFKDLYKEKISSVCFSSTSTYEVVIGEKKLVGSAQKRLKDSVLQHGSILVGNKHLELIDLLNIDDRLRSRFLELTKNKTVSVSEVYDVKDHNTFYKKLTDCLYASLSEEFGCETEKTGIDKKDMLEISEIESYFDEL